MKSGMKKRTALAVAVLFVLSLMGTSVMASDGIATGTLLDFNDYAESETPPTIVCYQSGGQYYNRNQSNPIYYRNTFEEAFAGRQAGDHSYAVYYDNFNNSGGNNRIQDQYCLLEENAVATQEVIDSGYDESVISALTTEFSILAGGAFDKYKLIFRGVDKDGNLGWSEDFFVMTSSGITCRDKTVSYTPGQWTRVAVTFYSNNNIDVWVNGDKVISNTWISTTRNLASIKYARIVADNWGSALSPRYLTLGFDDIYVHDGVYDAAADAVTYTFKDYSYIDAKSSNAVVLPEGADVQSLIAALNTDAFYSVYSDAALSDKLTEGTIPEGAYLLLQSKNQRMIKYIKLTYDTSLKALADMNFNDETGMPVYDLGTNTSSYEGGLFTKEADDKAFVLNESSDSVDGLTGRFALDNGITELNDTNWDNMLFTKPVVTMEISAFASGNTNVMLYGSARMYSVENPSENVRVFKKFFEIADNGSVVVRDAEVQPVVKKDEWVRLAITFYPEEKSYDLYVNGEKTVSRGLIDEEHTDTENYIYRGMSWLSIRSTGSAEALEQAGKIGIDDYKVYLGEYVDTDDKKVSLTTELPMDEKNLIIYAENMELSEFAAALDYGVCTAAIYEDADYQNAASEIGEGNRLVITSPDGLVKKYYTVMPVSESMDSGITLYANGEQTGILPNTGTISAKINAYAPTLADRQGVLVLAVYEDGMLKKIIADTKKISLNTTFEVNTEIEKTDKTEAKAMFVDSFSSMRPLVPSALYTKN